MLNKFRNQIKEARPITPGLLLSEGAERCLNEYKDSPGKQWEILILLYNDPGLITTDLSPHLRTLITYGIKDPKNINIPFYLMSKMLKFVIDNYTSVDKTNFGIDLFIMIFKLINSSNGYYSYHSDHIDEVCYYILEQCNISQSKLSSLLALFDLD